MCRKKFLKFEISLFDWQISVLWNRILYKKLRVRNICEKVTENLRRVFELKRRNLIFPCITWTKEISKKLQFRVKIFELIFYSTIKLRKKQEYNYYSIWIWQRCQYFIKSLSILTEASMKLLYSKKINIFNFLMNRELYNDKYKYFATAL